MPTTFPDIFWVIDPFSPPPVGTALTAVEFDVTDQNDNGLINRFSNDSIDGTDITASYPGDTVTVTLSGGGTQSYTGVTFYLADGREVFTPTDGQTLVDATFQSSSFVTTQNSVTPEELEPVCFTPGTELLTPHGMRSVDLLCVGDLVETLDHGAQPIRWIARSFVPGSGRYAPICIAEGALGNARPLAVSPQHRFLFKSWRAQLYFGTDEVLAAAIHLVDGERIVQRHQDRDVEYIHIMFDRHEVVFAEGIPTESFHPGDHFLARDSAARDELLDLFPDLERLKATHGPTARLALKAHEVALLDPAPLPDHGRAVAA